MNEFCAAMGICNLRHVEEEIHKRKSAVDRYRNHLSGIEGIQLLQEKKEVKYNYGYFPIVVDEKVFGASRNEIFDSMKQRGFCPRKYFYPLTNSFDCFHGKYDVNKTPIALHISKRVLTLPVYADLSMDDVDRICDIIIKSKGACAGRCG